MVDQASLSLQQETLAIIREGQAVMREGQAADQQFKTAFLGLLKHMVEKD